MARNVIKENDISVSIKNVIKRYTLNYTDIVNNNNKYYNLEIVESTDNKFFLYTNYGRVGGTAAKEYRLCLSQVAAENEANKIIKSKLKKGYVEIKLVQAAVGSDLGKSKIEISQASVDDLKKIGMSVVEENCTSKLHKEVAALIRTWFGVTAEFVEMNLDTKKCPLGQLSIDSIIKGRDILEEARKIIHSSNDITELNRLTNLYYSNIPHNFGYTRIDANTLRLDNDNKIDKAFDILDVFSDAKNVEKVISSSKNNSQVDHQYDTLHADLEFVEPSSDTWKWLQSMVLQTRAKNHAGLGKIAVHKIFKLNRHNENELFMQAAEEIASKNCKFNPSPVYANLVKERPDIPNELKSIYSRANVLPGWHGTRRANMIGITTKGLLIRPSGVIHAGSMYGDGIYWATNSSKSINYCDVRGSYWAQGNNKTAYLFLGDVAFGNQKVAGGSYYYTKDSIKPNHSVYAKAGGAVYNDELITYTPSGKGQQHVLRYIIEFETMAA